MHYRLYGIPEPLVDESLASWIQRVCQLYNLTYPEFYESMGLLPSKDPDLCLSAIDIPKISAICNISTKKFKYIESLFCRMKHRSNLRRYMRKIKKIAPFYWFCTKCWESDETPYLRGAWRLECWAYCPTHRIRMRSTCPNCDRRLAIQCSLLANKSGGQGVSSFIFCRYCRQNMCVAANNEPVEAIDEFEREMNLLQQKIIIANIPEGFDPFHDLFNLHLRVLDYDKFSFKRTKFKLE